MYDPEYLLQRLIRDAWDDVTIRAISQETFQPQINYLEGLRAKWLKDPVKYLGPSPGLTLEDNAKEIAAVKKRMVEAETAPARLCCTRKE